MKRGVIGCLVLLLFVSCLFTGVSPAKEKVSKQDLLKVLDPIVDKTLNAYNVDDDVKFFEYFAQRMHDMTTPKYFKQYYLDTIKKDIGDYISRRLLDKKCSFDQFYPVVVYKGTFKNNDKVIITVTFMNEHGFYRITNVEFQKVYFDD